MQYDSATGLYYDNARYYDMVIGRFMSQDPKGFAAGDSNLYRYVGNGPTDGIDPTGNDGSSSVSGVPAGEELIAGVNASIEPDHTSTGSSSSGDLLDNTANLAAGWGSSLSMGLTDRIRDNLSIGGVSLNAGIDQNSSYYQVGQAIGTTQSIALSFVNPCAAGSVSSGVAALNLIQATGGTINAAENASGGNYVAAVGDLIGVFGNASQLSQSCFAAGTPILTPNGAKPIEQFRPGDWVLSCPEDDPEASPEPRRVEAVLQNYSALLELEVGGQLIRTTAEHPFWVRGRGWTAVHQLMAGDHLKSQNGRWMVLEAVMGKLEGVAVYNIQVTEYHTYFVGRTTWGFSVWAHNSKCIYKAPRPGQGDDLMSSGFSKNNYPVGASFTPDYELAEEYAYYYKQGIIKITIPDETYSQSYQSLEKPYISNTSQTEMLIPPELFDDLNSHSKTLISDPWIGPYTVSQNN